MPMQLSIHRPAQRIRAPAQQASQAILQGGVARSGRHWCHSSIACHLWQAQSTDHSASSSSAGWWQRSGNSIASGMTRGCWLAIGLGAVLFSVGAAPPGQGLAPVPWAWVAQLGLHLLAQGQQCCHLRRLQQQLSGKEQPPRLAVPLACAEAAAGWLQAQSCGLV